MLTQVTWNRPQLFALCDSTMSSASDFYFYEFYYNLKEKDHIRRYDLTILICQKLELIGPVQQKIKLPSSKRQR